MGLNDSENGLVIEHYLRGAMSAEDEAGFEEAYLGSEELLDQLELGDMLGRGLRELAALEKSSQATMRPKRMSSLLRSPQYAMAASFLLVVLLGVSGVMYHRVDELTDLLASQASPAQIVPLVAVRADPGAEPVNIISLDPQTRAVVLMLDPGFEPFPQYRATVTEVGPARDQPVIFQSDQLTPGYEDMLALSVPAALLKPGYYEIHVEGVSRDDASQRIITLVGKLTLQVTAAN